MHLCIHAWTQTYLIQRTVVPNKGTPTFLDSYEFYVVVDLKYTSQHSECLIN